MECPLSEIKKGKQGIVTKLEGGDYFQRKIFSLGIVTGKKIKVISSQPLGGPVVLQIGSSRVAIGKGMAMKILVDVK